MRIDADHLYCVPLDELLTKFVPRRLYLEINNSPGGSTSRARRSDPASWFSTVPFRIHVRSPDSEPGRQHPHTLSLARVIPREESVSPDASRWLGDPLVDNIFRVSIMINFDPRNLDNPFTRNFENPIAIFSYRVDACQRKKEPSWLAVIIGYCQGGTQLYCRVEEFTLQNKKPERERIGRRDSGISSVGSIGSSSSELEEDLEDKYEDLLNWDCRKPLGNFADMDYIELECGHVVGVTARRGNFEETGRECPHHGARCCATFHPVLEITFS
ncbi:hypothetical protein QBC46DRAFT_399277 [Diplogelasinospora grovesii]|uniref:Uncharacterized protein n=1 Tax=Diplogelasinospora grovesii TaxID=303347 RepID=A0AAN6MWB4_9PEZI|nr:hypothetical protein QBC46DRAFT_399277 [Diplogelasinospora grovesii]